MFGAWGLGHPGGFRGLGLGARGLGPGARATRMVLFWTPEVLF